MWTTTSAAVYRSIVDRRPETVAHSPEFGSRPAPVFGFSPGKLQEGEGDEGNLTTALMGGGAIWFGRAAKSSGGGASSSTMTRLERVAKGL
jgi:hypothetical protein